MSDNLPIFVMSNSRLVRHDGIPFGSRFNPSLCVIGTQLKCLVDFYFEFHSVKYFPRPYRADYLIKLQHVVFELNLKLKKMLYFDVFKNFYGQLILRFYCDIALKFQIKLHAYFKTYVDAIIWHAIL